MNFRDEDVIRIPKKAIIDFSKDSFNPAEDITEYELTTFGRYRDERNREASRKWYEQHKQADAMVVNQDGDPLYALYKSPLGSHEETTDALFKFMRANRLNDDEY